MNRWRAFRPVAWIVTSVMLLGAAACAGAGEVAASAGLAGPGVSFGSVLVPAHLLARRAVSVALAAPRPVEDGVDRVPGADDVPQSVAGAAVSTVRPAAVPSQAAGPTLASSELGNPVWTSRPSRAPPRGC